jgi:hypothetical protein
VGGTDLMKGDVEVVMRDNSKSLSGCGWKESSWIFENVHCSEMQIDIKKW